MSEEKKTMADFEDEINASFVTFNEGDIIQGTVVAVEEEEIVLDLQSFSQGVIPAGEYSDDPDFRAMDEIRVGDVLNAMVLYEDEMGRTVLSWKRAKETESWEALRSALQDRTVYEVRVKNTVNAGVVAYVEGIRGFIPASQLALHYVEEGELENYVGKMVKARVITVDEEAGKLVLSAKDVAKEEAAKVHEAKLNALQKGFITEGTITRIESYGCFVEIGDDLTGLVHISQICNKFLKSPKEVVHLGMKVKVKVLDVAEGKIRLSMKQAEDIAPEELEDLQRRVDEIVAENRTAESENRIREREINDRQIHGMKVIFGGFCVLLAVIGIGNVFSNTLGFVRQRKREFARYLSVGLTPEGIRKMFCIEALVLAGRPALITLPLAVLSVGYMLKLSYLDAGEFLAEAPLLPIAAFWLMILGSVALAYVLGWRTVRKLSLTELLWDDTVM